MRVFLFRIFFQRINLMNPKSEPIQLVLPYLYLSFYLMPQIMIECACAHDTVFDICLLIGFIDTRVFACARHLASFYILAGLPLTTMDLHVQIQSLERVNFLLLIRVHNGIAVDPSGVFFFQTLVLSSRYFLLLLVSTFYTVHSCISTCSSFFCAS